MNRWLFSLSKCCKKGPGGALGALGPPGALGPYFPYPGLLCCGEYLRRIFWLCIVLATTGKLGTFAVKQLKDGEALQTLVAAWTDRY